MHGELEGLGDWLDADDVCDAVRNYAREREEARKANEIWFEESQAHRYFAWRWHYADMMLKAREA